MKLLSIAFSLLIFVWLATDYLDSANSQDQKANELAEIKVYQPKKLQSELLAVEKSWQAKKAERNKESEPQKEEQAKPVTQQVLAIGDQEYILYGIFNDPKKPFILLKDKSGNMVRLAKGEQLGQDATLVSLKSNRISFERNSELIEFKLFERKK